MTTANSICEAIKGYNNQKARIERLQEAHQYKEVANYDTLIEQELTNSKSIIITSAKTFNISPIDFLDLIEIYLEDGKKGIYQALNIC